MPVPTKFWAKKFGFAYLEHSLLTPLWLAGMVFAHIILIALASLILEWKLVISTTASLKLRIRYIMWLLLSAFASVFKRIRFRFLSSTVHDGSDGQKVLINGVEEMLFNLIVFSEQIVMFIFIYKSTQKNDLIEKTLYVVIFLFIFAKVTEVAFHGIFVTPGSTDGKFYGKCLGMERRYTIKRNIGNFMGVLSFLSLIILTCVFYPNIIWPVASLIVMIFPLILMLSCGNLCCKKNEEIRDSMHVKAV